MSDIQNILVKAAYLRGSFINDTILLERVIDEFICRHFCSEENKKVELLESLMSTKRITFDSKLAVAKFIIDNHYPEFDEKYPNYKKDITDIITHRNVFAHFLLDTSDDGVEKMKLGGIQFLKFEKKTIPVLYDDLQIKEIDKKIRMYVNAFGDMQ
jgi:hypothetical protein